MNIEAKQLLSPKIYEIINLINFGISIFDADQKLIVCNDAFLETLNYPKEFSVQGTALRVFHEYNAERGEYGPKDHAKAVVEDRLKMMTSGKPFSVERVRPNGQTIIVNCAPIKGGGFIATYQDATHTKRIITQLQEHGKELNEIMRVSVECLPHGISVFDRDLRLKICNSKFLQLLEFPLSLGEPGTKFEAMVRYNVERGEYGDADPEEIVETILEKARQFEPHKFVRQRPNGIYLEIAGQPMEYGFVTTYRDVTSEQNELDGLNKNKIELTAQLQASQSDFQTTSYLLQNVLDTIPIRVFWKDVNSIYQGGNKSYIEDRHLKNAHELEGQSDHDMFDAPQAEIFVSQDKEVIESGEAKLNMEETFLDDQNNEKWIKTNKIPLFDAHNICVGLLGTYEDITARKETEFKIKALNENLEKEVTERTKELRKSNHELGNALQSIQATQNELIEAEKMASLGGLVSGIAHEVNTPIGISVTAASLFEEKLGEVKSKLDAGALKKSDLDTFFENAEENCKMVLSNLSRAAKLIGSFKKVAVDQSSEDIRKLYLREYIEEVLLNLTPKLKRTNITIDTDMKDDLSITTDPGSIAQIITNLVMNSVIHGFPENEEGQVTIHAEANDGFIHFLYNDNGKGMNNATVNRIFDPFFTTRRGQGGSGLGMNIVYNLVTQKLKGRIKCISQPEKGTQFLITIPQNITTDKKTQQQIDQSILDQGSNI
ncbi:PAS-domain containing protein [Curvivirga sp.]|uniref:PAS-domain containing protein n=1 Tax=Curvivirga sp. TaxID=2856848 RepID=UPI003B5C1104